MAQSLLRPTQFRPGDFPHEAYHPCGSDSFARRVRRRKGRSGARSCDAGSGRCRCRPDGQHDEDGFDGEGRGSGCWREDGHEEAVVLRFVRLLRAHPKGCALRISGEGKWSNHGRGFTTVPADGDMRAILDFAPHVRQRDGAEARRERGRAHESRVKILPVRDTCA